MMRVLVEVENGDKQFWEKKSCSPMRMLRGA
jgi:hypothetical protein